MEQLKQPLLKFVANESLVGADSLVIHSFFEEQMKRHLPVGQELEDPYELERFCGSFKPILPLFEESVVEILMALYISPEYAEHYEYLDWDQVEKRFIHLIAMWSKETDIVKWEPGVGKAWQNGSPAASRFPQYRASSLNACISTKQSVYPPTISTTFTGVAQLVRALGF